MKKAIFFLIILSLGFSGDVLAQDLGNEDPQDCDNYVPPDPVYTSYAHREGNDLIETDCTTTAPDCHGEGGGTECVDTDLGTYDCNNELNGGAYLDDCQKCVGGSTNKEPCVPCTGTSSVWVTAVGGATPKSSHLLSNQGADIWGLTTTETMEFDISACSDGSQWHAVLNGITGHYAEQERLIIHVQEVTGTGGNTTQTNFCDQVTDLRGTTYNATSWYMLSAVQAHEDYHATHMQPSLQNASTNIQALVEALTVQDNGQGQSTAISQLMSSSGYQQAANSAVKVWDTEFIAESNSDDGAGVGPTYTAELNATASMRASICSFAVSAAWAVCAACQ
jgi:hypothetical protein